jgi:tetratricopeptide (TPR) repeat protein
MSEAINKKRKNLILFIVLFFIVGLTAIYIFGRDVTSYDLGLLYLRKGEIPDAIRKFEDSINEDPNNVKAYYYLARAYQKAGLPKEKVISTYKKALATDEMFIEAYREIGIIHAKNRDYKKAEDEFFKMLKINPNSTEAYNNLGFLYFEQQKYREAIDAYNRAIDINPKDTFTWNNLGLLYYTINDLEKAKQVFANGIANHGEDPTSYYFLALIAEKNNDDKIALSYWNKCIKLGITGERLREAKEHIRKLNKK